MGGRGGKKRRERDKGLRVQAITSPPRTQAYTESPERLIPQPERRDEDEEAREDYRDNAFRVPVTIHKTKG